MSKALTGHSVLVVLWTIGIHCSLLTLALLCAAVVQFADSIGLPTDEGLFGFRPFAEQWCGRLVSADYEMCRPPPPPFLWGDPDEAWMCVQHQGAHVACMM